MTPRTFTPARIVALALIALVVAGLGYLRFAPDSGVSVPSGARAGDLTLERCDYATEDGGYAADCGTLVVPENRADPQSRLIALPVRRIRAQSDSPAEPLFRLEGGPGKTNMEFAMASRYAATRDVVLVGYRGVDGSVRLDCPEVVSALKHSTDLLSEKSMTAYGDALRSCAERLEGSGVDLAGYTFTQRVEDLEAARRALGYDRVDLVSESAGTRTALIYSWRHPESVHRSVMVGANPPGRFLWDAKTTDEQFARYAAYCEQDAGCSKRTDDLVASLRRTSADIPDRWLGLPIKESNIRVGTFYGMHESTEEAGLLMAPAMIDSWLATAGGDASGLWLLSFAADVAFPTSFVWGEMASMGRADDAAAREYFSATPRKSILGDGHPATTFVWGGGRLADAWPAAPDEAENARMRPSAVGTLLVNGELDFTTPPQVAKEELLPYLPNGRQVVLQGFGHSTDFWTYQPEAGTRLVTAFLDSGRVDRSQYRPQHVDFTPEAAHPALAKGIAGGMVGLALLTVLSLLVMARRVRKRGGYGRKASAVLRSLYPVVLGLGGWLLGVLIVITTMPGVPIDDELLAMLSVGAPVGLGIYLAWVQRGSATQSKGLGLAAALAGALVGAWLGFHATADLLALVTAIGGAVSGANLMLVALDIAAARSARERGAAPEASSAVVV